MIDHGAATKIAINHEGAPPDWTPAIEASECIDDWPRRRESRPPSHPKIRALNECPIRTKFSVVPPQVPRSLAGVEIQRRGAPFPVAAN